NVIEGIALASEPGERLEPFAAVAEAVPVEATPVPEPEREPEPLPAEPAPEPSATAPPTQSDKLPPDAKPRLVVLRGLKINSEYPIYEGLNFIGRADEKPVDIDLDDQEPPDRVWSSRQHALITFEDGKLSVEDLNSANGTFVNRTRIYPGQKRELAVGDVLQIGTVQMKLIV
ncbi:MAG TPA: FHA domain-containing protein, partial [Gemmataceae bacterium]|nr:FHA domain-containing protein [Gemmataceae bacterium]